MNDNTEDEDAPSWFQRIEEWSLYHDLHIWYGIISFIALLTLGFIIEKEMTKTERLSSQIIVLQQDLNASQLLVVDLKAENERQRQLYLTQKDTVTETLDKSAAKVNDKLTKVQDVLIDKAVQQQPKTKTQTITTTVEVKTVVNKELNTMMKDTYCTTVPSAKECVRK